MYESSISVQETYKVESGRERDRGKMSEVSRMYQSSKDGVVEQDVTGVGKIDLSTDLHYIDVQTQQLLGRRALCYLRSTKVFQAFASFWRSVSLFYGGREG